MQRLVLLAILAGYFVFSDAKTEVDNQSQFPVRYQPYFDRLDDIEDTLDEILEELEGDDDDDDLDDDDDVDDDDSSSSEEDDDDEPRRRHHSLHDAVRKSIQHVVRFMRRHDIDDVDDVPGRKLAQQFRRIHNYHRRGQESDEEHDWPMRRERLYDKVLRQAQRRVSQSEQMFGGICSRLGNRTEPRERRMFSLLPGSIRMEIEEVFDDRHEMMVGCCQMEEDEQEDCFQDAYEIKHDGLCMLHLGLDDDLTLASGNSRLLMRMSQRQECCQILEPAERMQCFRRRGRHERRQRRSIGEGDEAWHGLSAERRAEKVCRKFVDDAEEPSDRRAAKLNRMTEEERSEHQAIMEQMARCCEQEGDAKLTCLRQVKAERMTSICEQERFRGRGAERKQQMKDECCHLDDEELDECFSARMQERMREVIDEKMERRQGRRQERRQGRKQERRDGRQERKQTRKERRRDRRRHDDDDESRVRRASDRQPYKHDNQCCRDGERMAASKRIIGSESRIRRKCYLLSAHLENMCHTEFNRCCRDESKKLRMTLRRNQRRQQ